MIILVVEMINIKTNLTEALRCLIILLGNTNEATMKYYFKGSHTHLEFYGKPLDLVLLY